MELFFNIGHAKDPQEIKSRLERGMPMLAALGYEPVTWSQSDSRDELVGHFEIPAHEVRGVIIISADELTIHATSGDDDSGIGIHGVPDGEEPTLN